MFTLAFIYPAKFTMTNMIKLCLKTWYSSLNATLDNNRPVYNGTKTSAEKKKTRSRIISRLQSIVLA